MTIDGDWLLADFERIFEENRQRRDVIEMTMSKKNISNRRPVGREYR